MAEDDNLTIRISVDATGVLGGTQQVEDAFNRLRVSAEQWQAAIRAAGTTDLSKVAAQLEMTASAQRAANETAEAAATATDRYRVATAGALRETIALGHELVAGNFSRIPEGTCLTI